MEEAIRHLKQCDQRLCKVIDYFGDIPLNTYNDPFSFLVGEIIGQMISNSVRRVIIERLRQLCGGAFTPEAILQHSEEEIKKTGMSASKAMYIRNLAQKTHNKELVFDEFAELEDKEIIKRLKSLKGIGDWTAKMFLLFHLGRNDVLPYEDGAFLQSYKWLYNTKVIKAESIIRRCKKWKPYSSIGARYMYYALDNGLTRIPIDTFLNGHTNNTER